MPLEGSHVKADAIGALSAQFQRIAIFAPTSAIEEIVALAEATSTLVDATQYLMAEQVKVAVKQATETPEEFTARIMRSMDAPE